MAISFVDDGGLSAATSSPLSVSLPTHSEGDFLMLVVADRVGSGGFANLSVPAGWNGPIAASKYHTNDEGIRAFWKIAGPSETDPISVSTTGNAGSWGAAIFAYSGVDALDPLDTGYRWDILNGANVSEGTPMNTRAMTDGAVAVVLAMTSDDNNLALKSGSEQGFTQRLSADTTVGDDFSLFVADKTVTNGGDVVTAPTVEQTVNSGDVFLGLGILTLKPAGANPVGPRLVHSQAGLDSGVDAPSSSTIPISFDVQADDLILLAVATRATSAPTVTVVTSGYTQLVANTTNSPPGGFVFYKVAAGGETSIEVTNDGGNFGWIMAVQVWRGVDTSTPFDVTTQVNTATNTVTHTAPSITPTTDHCAVVSFGMIGHDPTTPQISAAQGFQECWVDGRLWMTATAFDAGLYAADKYVATAASTTGPTFDNNDGVATIEWVGVSAALRLAASASQDLTGTTFQKAPTFPQGVVTASYDLTGTAFQKAPSFVTGTVAFGDVVLPGTTFQKTPTFPQGAVAASYGLTGATFQKAPTFNQGAVDATYGLTGSTFQKAPAFGTGTVATGAANLAGSTFEKAPSFPQGTVAPGAVNLTGATFQQAPSFPQGAVGAAGSDLTGSTFQKTPTFPQGAVAASFDLAGSTFQKAPTFGSGAVAAGAVALQGTVYQVAPSFPQGTVEGAYTLTGTTFEKAPTFPQGAVTVGAAALVGQVFAVAPTFPQGELVGGVRPRWRDVSLGASVKSAGITAGVKTAEVSAGRKEVDWS